MSVCKCLQKLPHYFHSSFLRKSFTRLNKIYQIYSLNILDYHKDIWVTFKVLIKFKNVRMRQWLESIYLWNSLKPISLANLLKAFVLILFLTLFIYDSEYLTKTSWAKFCGISASIAIYELLTILYLEWFWEYFNPRVRSLWQHNKTLLCEWVLLWE